ncbi:hypothetical protein [Streptomyces sp. RKAG337]|uniref:hypothetical protein n=1 Tax=Streptomyces sp. RKAG337 TaxID=2893404 RepID=UPI0020348036|nr:hypothetical protein [Streptomyces sp. RKAG337]MCM2430900.1 hypothetical protein [Streptomyces sp. RKAG337]
MGTNSKSSHASYAIAPSDAPQTVEGAEQPPVAATEPELSDELVIAKTDLMVAMDNLETIAAGGDYPSAARTSSPTTRSSGTTFSPSRSSPRGKPSRR